MSTAADNKASETKAAEATATAPSRKRKRLHPDVEAHMDLINGAFDAPEFGPRNAKIKRIINQCVKDVMEVVTDDSDGSKYDIGEAITAIRTMRTAKDMFSVAMQAGYTKERVRKEIEIEEATTAAADTAPAKKA